jgi:hypothetical protein
VASVGYSGGESPGRGFAMTDTETREILRATLELLKTQMMYVRNLHDAFGALHDAVMRVDPRLEQFDKEEILKIRLNPVQQSQIDALDGLLKRLVSI